MSDQQQRVRIVQCLCGAPERHCIAALPYMPGKEGLTRDNAAQACADLIKTGIEQKQIKPVCGLCGRPAEQWIFEDAPTRFATMEEAIPHLEQSAMEQAATRAHGVLESILAAARAHRN